MQHAKRLKQKELYKCKTQSKVHLFIAIHSLRCKQKREQMLRMRKIVGIDTAYLCSI